MSHSSTRWTAIAALSIAVACGPAATPALAQHAAASAADQYLGTWNYDQPDAASMTNIATMDLFGYRPDIPQIGTVTFSRAADGEVLGHTDQGCTWHFTPVPGALEMTSTNQYCFNHVIGSGYNIDRWRVTVHDGVEHETLHANSYLAGATFSFELNDGRRTNAAAGTQADTARRFSGTWTYDHGGFPTNVATNSLFVPVMLTPTPMTGPVTFATNGGTVTARTAEGCDWTFQARGNTAELTPAVQHCGATTLTFWSIASDAGHQTDIVAGTDHGTPFMVTSGALTEHDDAR